MSERACSSCGGLLAESQARRFGALCPACMLRFAAEDGLPEFPGVEILSTLGKGGMGVVYEAIQSRLGRRVALKVLSPHLAFNASFMRRFNAEAHLLARLQHPNIVTVHDIGVHGGLPYILLERVEGASLRALLKKGPLPLGRALEIAGMVCDALDCAHGAGVIHRDIKPENILIDERGQAKLVDFGLAISANLEERRGTRARIRVGTPRYMSPEQLQRPEEVDGRADLYSVGVVLLELLTGTPPRKRGQGIALPRTLPAPVAAFLKKLLAIDPKKRVASAKAARAALESLRASASKEPSRGREPR
jgi:serine/threonine protein kinase